MWSTRDKERQAARKRERDREIEREQSDGDVGRRMRIRGLWETVLSLRELVQRKQIIPEVLWITFMVPWELAHGVCSEEELVQVG